MIKVQISYCCKGAGSPAIINDFGNEIIVFILLFKPIYPAQKDAVVGKIHK